jgi:hypothetical protein
MGTKLVIDGKEIDMVRGINIPRIDELVMIKQKGETETHSYIVDSIDHTIDFSHSLALSKTLINLKRLKEIEDD